MLQAIQKLFFDRCLYFGGYERLGLALSLPLLVPLVDPFHLFLRMHPAYLQFSLADYHLVQLGQPLLALVALELGPVLEVLVEDGQRLLVVAGEGHLLPQLLGQVRPLDRLHVEVALAFLLEHRRVPAVSEGARVTRAKPSQVVLITTESLLDGPVKGNE